MRRRLTARATVLATLVLSLAALSACNDAVGLSDGLGGTALNGEDTAFLRGGNGGRGGKNAVASIEITPSDFAVAAGIASRLQAITRNSTGRVVSSTPTWLSTDPAVATVSEGTVLGVKPGSALILATVNGKTDTAVATITQIALPVDGVVLSPTEANLIVGERLALSATAIASDGSALIDRPVTWTSASPEVATVSAAGELVAVASGTTTVAAAVDGITTSASVTVSPVPAVPVATVSVTPSPASVREGATLELHARLLDGSGNDLGARPVTWISSNDGVVSVSGDGILTGVAAGTATVTASAEGRSGTTTVTVTPSTVPVASITMSATSASVEAGQTLQLIATPKDASGNELGGRAITWATSNGAAATVTQAGLVQGVAAGSATITATAEGRTGSTAVTVTAPAAPAPEPAPAPAPEPAPEPPPATSPSDRVGFYVSPTGAASNAGTKDSPWSLAAALSGTKLIAPGDTVWVRGGTYRGVFNPKLVGQAGKLIVVRAYPGERATIDGSFFVQGSHVALWGLEVMNSAPLSSRVIGVDVHAPGAHLINLVVHDAGMSGVGLWNAAPNAVLHGSIIYNNGNTYNLDHGVYFNGNTGTKYVSDNIVFNNYAYGLHAYSPYQGELNSLRVDGNVSFNNGSTGPDGHSIDLHIGGSLVSNSVVSNNMTWRRNDGEITLRLLDGQNVSMSGNRAVGGNIIASSWSRSNDLLWSSSAPPTSGIHVLVRRNAFEAGRANITVYNWSLASSVSADLSGVLRVGDTYEVRNAQNFYGTPVVRGTYGGGAISLPMNEVQPLPLIGRTGRTPESTGRVFHAFVVLKTN